MHIVLFRVTSCISEALYYLTSLNGNAVGFWCSAARAARFPEGPQHRQHMHRAALHCSHSKPKALRMPHRHQLSMDQCLCAAGIQYVQTVSQPARLLSLSS